MFTTIKNWFNKPSKVEARFDQLEQQMSDLSSTKAKLEQELSVANEQLELFRTKDEADAAKRNGTEPWVEVKSAGLDPVKGIQIELDWNDAFVQYLKDNGITGRDDETTVQKWLALLYEDLINRLEAKVVENSDKKTVSDFL